MGRAGGWYPESCKLAPPARVWPVLLLVVAGGYSGVWCVYGAVVVDVQGGACGRSRGVGYEARKGDDAVFLKTGLIFGRTMIFESVTFLISF